MSKRSRGPLRWQLGRARVAAAFARLIRREIAATLEELMLREESMLRTLFNDRGL